MIEYPGTLRGALDCRSNLMNDISTTAAPQLLGPRLPGRDTFCLLTISTIRGWLGSRAVHRINHRRATRFSH